MFKSSATAALFRVAAVLGFSLDDDKARVFSREVEDFKDC